MRKVNLRGHQSVADTKINLVKFNSVGPSQGRVRHAWLQCPCAVRDSVDRACCDVDVQMEGGSSPTDPVR